MRSGRETWLSIAITAAAALTFLLTHPLDVFWTTDGGNRFIQVQQIVRSGSVAIDYPARDIDPAFAAVPTGGHHFLIHHDRLVSFYSPAFPLLVAPLYKVFGTGGLYVIPLLSMLIAIPLFAAIARELGADRWSSVAAMALVFATPLFFYSVSFWEHTVAIALTLGGILLVLRRKPVPGAIVIAASAVFREEGYIALSAVAIALALTKRMREAIALSIAAGAVLVPLWTLNYFHYGHPLGVHSAVYGEIASGGLPQRLSNFWFYLFSFSRAPAVSIAMALPALVLLATAPLRATRHVARLRVVLLYLSAAASCAGALLLITSEEPLADLLTTQSLFGALPFAVTFLAVARELPRFLTIVIASAIVLTTVLLHQGDIGRIWGPRHFLWLIPLLLIAAVHALRLLPNPARAAIATLFVASFAIQMHGLRLLSAKLTSTGQTLATLRASAANVVLTDVFWIPEEMAALWFERRFLFVSSDRQLAALLERLKSVGIRRADFVASRGFHHVSPHGYAPLLAQTYERRLTGGVRGTDSVQILSLDLARPDSRSRTASPPRTDPRPASQP